MLAFFGVTFFKSEFQITNRQIDSLGIDENDGPVIFEYKRSVNEDVINQGLFYLDWLLEHIVDFKLLVMKIMQIQHSINNYPRNVFGKILVKQKVSKKLCTH